MNHPGWCQGKPAILFLPTTRQSPNEVLDIDRGSPHAWVDSPGNTDGLVKSEISPPPVGGDFHPHPHPPPSQGREDDLPHQRGGDFGLFTRTSILGQDVFNVESAKGGSASTIRLAGVLVPSDYIADFFESPQQDSGQASVPTFERRVDMLQIASD